MILSTTIIINYLQDAAPARLLPLLRALGTPQVLRCVEANPGQGFGSGVEDHEE